MVYNGYYKVMYNITKMGQLQYQPLLKHLKLPQPNEPWLGTPGLDLYPSPSIAPPTSLDATGFSSTASAACLPLGTAAAAALGATAAPAARGTERRKQNGSVMIFEAANKTDKNQGNLKW
jgi:hypothetical protein